MCGRYALAADADEIPLQFWRQYQPDHQDSVQDDPTPTDEGQTSLGESSEQAQSAEETGDGFRSASALPRGRVGGLTPVEGSELGRSAGAGAGGAGAGKGVGVAPIEWASDQAKWMYRKRYNVAPRTRCPVVRRDPSGKLVVDSLRWGIIPNWSKEEPGLQPINARDDGIKSGSGMWSGLRNKKRCVVVMDGWYEWTQSGNKVPYFTRHKDNKFVIMAGLWDHCELPDKEDKLTRHPIDTFTIVTTNSNKQLGFLHGRMPVILDNPADLELWLSTETWGPKLEKLLKPYDKKLECYQVPPEVGKVQNDSPEFVKPVEQRKGGIASLFAKQAAKSPPRPASPPDLSKPALRMTSPTAERKPKLTPAKVPLPSKIDSFFGKMGAPDKPKKTPKRKATTAASVVKSEEGSSDVEIIEESPAKKVKVAVKHEGKGGAEEVEVFEEKGDGAAELEQRGVQEVENPA